MSEKKQLSCKNENTKKSVNTVTRRTDFLRSIINEDLKTGKYNTVITRFPPEPNGYPHIGHAKSICLNFGIANDYQGGKCHLRMDDTDPTKESMEYVESIMKDVKWLGFDWKENLFFASDYFEQLYNYAVRLIEMGKAYVCSLNEQEIREYRGTVTQSGKESPYRDRSIEENLDLFRKMRAGEFKDGEHVLRAKIDMASPNMKMRDPLLYRIRHAHHYRTGDKWCIYPMYDFAHCLSDYIEGITHSICTLEFENNRELYDWILDEMELELPRPYQYEFARLNLNYTVMSKRKLLELVEKKHVNGWDDPRMHTISGLRRRGYTPESIRNFCDSIGIAKANSIVDFAQLEFHIRDDLNQKVPRVLAVLKPLKVVIENYPEGQTEMLDAAYYPHDVPKEGSRQLPFSKVLYVERSDFMENPPKGYYRLSPGQEVRLRHAYVIKCEEVIKDANGEVTELRCSYDPQTKSGADTSDRKVKGTIHWVSAEHAKKAEVRLYDRLFLSEFPEGLEDLNPNSLEVLTSCLVEPSLAADVPGSRYQFERLGYFYMDPVDSTGGKLVFNRIVQLRDSWTRASKEPEQKKAETKSQQTAPKKEPKPTVEYKPEELTPEAQARLKHYQDDLGLPADSAALIAKDTDLSNFFEEAIAAYNSAGAVANWIINELLRELKEVNIKNLPFNAIQLAELVKLVDAGTISGKIAKDVFDELLIKGGSPRDIVEQKGLSQISDIGQLEPIVDKIIANNPENTAKYKEGRTNLLGFFVGQVIKETDGKANPKIVNDLVLNKLSKL
ncbi:MAG: hypothetical protein ACD_20C00086G0032 [uncultured bacterium]|nr:MAG: hypothetical protein ACD_20C00086G0032 [uncultured bacterium]HBH17439.1 glutamine--tRNA ligase [Cyanobacteria bacterium UBA9579]